MRHWSALGPMTAIVPRSRRKGNRLRAFLSSTMDSRATASASARCDGRWDDAVSLVHVVDRAAIGHDVAGKPPLAPKNGVEQQRAAAGGRPEHPVVGAHQGIRAGLADARFEVRQVALAEVPLAHDRVELMAEWLRPRVHGEMLHGRDGLQVTGIVALQPADERHRDPAGEIGVLAVRLLASSPARVAKQVDVGRPDGEALIPLVLAATVVVVMLGAKLVGDDRGHAEHETVVPCRREADRLRKDGREPRARHSMEALVPPVVLGDAQPLDRRRAVHHLRDFLLERHAPHEVSGALFERQAQILPRRSLSAGAAGEHGSEQDDEAKHGIAPPGNERQNDIMTASWRPPLPLLVACCLVPGGAASQTDHADPWAAPARGSWVRSGAAAAGDVVLASLGSGAEIVVGAAEPLNVRQAATFLAGDIETISGYRPPLVATPTPGRTSIRLVTLGNERLPSVIDASRLRGQWEAYRVVTAPRTVWLVGSNPRGTAFAAYTLSERLGVDPLYLWTGYVPEHHDPLVLEATRFAQGPPAFRYRGFFHDDEDILPRPFDARGYPLQTGDVPLAWHRRYEVQQLASDWGLYYTSHHYDILVSNPFGMTTFNLAAERGVRPDYDWFTNRDGLLTYWRGGVEENRDLDVIWPVGLRNTSDRPYTWPEGTTDSSKARVFREVIGLQTAMVRNALPPGRTPIFHFTMYSEMLDMYRRDPAAFGLPDDVIIVWPDDNDGHMRGLPTDRGRWKHGVYYHLAYLGGNLSKQTTHIVAPATIASEFQKIVQAGATEYMLVNVSELRDYVMGARMIADITWDAPAVYASPDPAGRFVTW